MRLILPFLIVSIISAETLKIKFTPGDHWHHSFKMGFFTVNTTPQFAIWLEDSSGQFLTTLSVTQKSAESNFTGARKSSRPSALPVWAHARGVKGSHGNFMPSRQTSLTDAVTSASPKDESTVNCDIPDSLVGKHMVLNVEINNSMDFNEFYRKDLPESSAGYNGKVNGQPSLIYRGIISPRKSFPDTLQLVGHGHAAGNDGKVYTDLSRITTASKIVKSIVVTELK